MSDTPQPPKVLKPEQTVELKGSKAVITQTFEAAELLTKLISDADNMDKNIAQYEKALGQLQENRKELMSAISKLTPPAAADASSTAVTA